MDLIQKLSLELISASSDMVKATKEVDVKKCMELAIKIKELSDSINNVVDTYKHSC